MRFKVVPEPRPRSFVRDAQAALPLVPSSEDDCCALLIADTELDSRDTAREWITFLQALCLVAESDGRYYQRSVDPPVSDLATAFRERVYAADEVLRVLDENGDENTDEDEDTDREVKEDRSDDEVGAPLSAVEIFERVRDIVPEWERNHYQDWETVWRERVRRLLEWAIEFDLAERKSDGYRR
jgi:hypothetical protein